MLRDETLEKVREVESLVEGGSTLKDALKKTQTATNTYYKGKKILKKLARKPYKKPKPYMQTIEVAPVAPQKLVALIGDAAQIRAFIGAMP